MAEPVEAKRNRTQTVLLGVIAACLIILVVVFVAVPIWQEIEEQQTVDMFNQVGSDLDEQSPHPEE